MSELFEGQEERLRILENALEKRNFLEDLERVGKWRPALVTSLERFKRSEGLPEKGVT